MDRRRKQMKKRIEKRKQLKRMEKMKKGTGTYTPYFDYQDPEQIPWISPEAMGQKGHPLFRKDVFLLKILISAILVFIVAFLYKLPFHQLEPIKNTVSYIMERDFQFAKAVDWYEKNFGDPLALFPNVGEDEDNSEGEYALPANGVILETFYSDDQGVTFQTNKNVQVTAVQDGIVIFAGEKEEMGKTVVIQHPDTTETWYGKLGDIYVRTYDSIKTGDAIGIVSSSQTKETGEFYFAVKKDEIFIDPIQVIRLE
ncbi:M23 family metallopeptidase [Fervidibacillus albus]|uniref:M23 family metallopeptidase n=1 Tax=Fervidibacillus albus TaxID=2980026 RepID=A0A9E8RWM9_9BACI|nr:M23 family metallopeptidase [Fervidibacillus albus]WAA10248.1 M23 family metallopeptidase [Fervidibacillus albus]